MQENFDILIRNASNVDGTGAPRFTGDIGIRGDRIARIGDLSNPVTPPLNLLDGEGEWFRFPTFAAYLDALQAQPAATNCAMLVGHTTLRVATMDDLTQPATAAQIGAMRELVDE